MILCGVAIDGKFLNNGVISSMHVHMSKKTFLAFPDSDDIMPQPLIAWKNWNAKDLFGPKLLAIWWVGMNLNDFLAPNSFKSLFKGTSLMMSRMYLLIYVSETFLFTIISNLFGTIYNFCKPFACPKGNSSLLLSSLVKFFDEHFVKNDRILWIKNILNKIIFLIANEWIHFFTACI